MCSNQGECSYNGGTSSGRPISPSPPQTPRNRPNGRGFYGAVPPPNFSVSGTPQAVSTPLNQGIPAGQTLGRDGNQFPPSTLPESESLAQPDGMTCSLALALVHLSRTRHILIPAQRALDARIFAARGHIVQGQRLLERVINEYMPDFVDNLPGGLQAGAQPPRPPPPPQSQYQTQATQSSPPQSQAARSQYQTQATQSSPQGSGPRQFNINVDLDGTTAGSQSRQYNLNLDFDGTTGASRSRQYNVNVELDGTTCKVFRISKGKGQFEWEFMKFWIL